MIATVMTVLVGFHFKEELQVSKVYEKLDSIMKAAHGLSYTATTTKYQAGKQIGKFSQLTVRAMKPNLVRAESPLDCTFSDGTQVYRFSPTNKAFTVGPSDPTGQWLPSGAGFYSFCAPSAFKPSYNRVLATTFLGRDVLSLEYDEPLVPGLTQKIYLDPQTYIPKGFEQITTDTVERTEFSKVDLVTKHDKSVFAWTPPSDAVDINKNPRKSRLLPTGTQAPKFLLKGRKSENLTLQSLLKNKKALVVCFWFYGCGYCQQEIPRLQKLYKSAKRNGLEVLMVNRGDDSINLINKFCKTIQLDVPIAVDGQSAVAKYGVDAFPTTYLINNKFEIVYRQSGYSDDIFDELLISLEKLNIPVR
jgi:peroxiredoxin/outer membrane lipoprotein-sorting protein